MEQDNLIAVSDIARLHGRGAGNVLRSLRSMGIEMVSLKSGKPAKTRFYISQEDYDSVRDRLGGEQRPPNDETPTPSSTGVFYLIQLEPELDPGRFKVGFTSDPTVRLSNHRTSAPFATLVKTWPSRMRWEGAAIDCITRDCDR